MVKTLRESKAKLSELVDRASRGEDVLITVRGRVKARLTQAAPQPVKTGAAWATELRDLQRSMKVRPKPRSTIEQIVAEQREDRL
jgi:prevent-host-death family protein